LFTATGLEGLAAAISFPVLDEGGNVVGSVMVDVGLGFPPKGFKRESKPRLSVLDGVVSKGDPIGVEGADCAVSFALGDLTETS